MGDPKKSLWTKIWQFLITSGIGFILDFITYTILTQKFGFRVATANILSSIVGATFAFIVSTHKIFDTNKTRIPLYLKYVMYILYQMVLILAVSFLGEYLNTLLTQNVDIAFINQNRKLICKVLITPITMTCNFLVMKAISEKV